METRAEFWRIYRESLPVLSIALLGGLFSGLVFDGLVGAADRFPGLLVMVPVFLATRGNVYGALGGRVASGLHQGLVTPAFERDDRLTNAVIAAFVNGIGLSIVIGIATWTALLLLGWEHAHLIEFVFIMFIAALLSSGVMVFGLLALLFAGFKRGYDPDNLVGPIVTTLGYVFGMFFLFFSVWLAGVVIP
jgi:mgtE-like transporter